MLEQRKRSSWVVATLALFILLHVRELDAARNIFWGRYKDLAGSSVIIGDAGYADERRAAFGSILLSRSALLTKKSHLAMPYSPITTVQ